MYFLSHGLWISDYIIFKLPHIDQRPEIDQKCNSRLQDTHPCRSMMSRRAWLECTCSTVTASGHHIGVMCSVSITHHGDTLAGIRASLLSGPGPVAAAVPLSAELTAGCPAHHLLCYLYILMVLSVNSNIGTGKSQI